MRIAVVTSTAGDVGGTETYLAQVLPRVRADGHELALCLERTPEARAPLLDTIGRTPTFVLDRDPGPQIAALRRWSPDVMLMNGIDSAAAERDLLAIAPSVLVAHTYRGTCISGSKMHAWPRPRPCGRPLGAACLALYFPRRCGGRSARTMIRAYRTEQARRVLLARYARILTLSDHMRREYVANGAEPERVHVLPPFGPRVDARSTRRSLDPGRRRLIFVGRMERAKGGLLLIEALSQVRRALDGSLDVVFVGDGRERCRWEAAATRLVARAGGVRISFTGWLPHDAVTDALAGADLLVLPGTWPEPFGLVGLEAAAVGVPAVAFDVGGIAQWLHDGVTGHLAAGSPPSSTSLAQAIVQTLRDPEHYARLSAQARALATVCTLEGHVHNLIAHLTSSAAPAAAHVNV